MRNDQQKVVEEWGKMYDATRPICSHDKFSYLRDFFQLSKQLGGMGAISQGDPTSFVMFNCLQCSFFWLVDADVAGVPK